MARTVFQGDHDGRGLVSQNPGACLFKPIKEGTWPALEVTDIETAALWSNFQILVKTAGYPPPGRPFKPPTAEEIVKSDH